jgi:hypothetical protein
MSTRHERASGMPRVRRFSWRVPYMKKVLEYVLIWLAIGLTFLVVWTLYVAQYGNAVIRL